LLAAAPPFASLRGFCRQWTSLRVFGHKSQHFHLRFAHGLGKRASGDLPETSTFEPQPRGAIDVTRELVDLEGSTFVFGFVRSQLIGQDATPVPPGNWIEELGRIRILSIPIEVFLFAGIALLAYLFLRFAKWAVTSI
jgi:hypothetical protein